MSGTFLQKLLVCFGSCSAKHTTVSLHQRVIADHLVGLKNE